MLLSVHNLRKHFNGVQALGGVSFTLREGERLGIIGPNGSGKSTIEGCIGGSIDPDEGEITFDGSDLKNIRPEERAHLGVARIFQMPQFLPCDTAAVNVWMGLYRASTWPQRLKRTDFSKSKTVQDALAFVGLRGDAETPANKLPFFGLRKMELARALISQPRLLLLDEPTSGLNSEQREEFESLLSQLRDVGIVLIEHEWHAIRRLCERVLIMQAGRVVADRVARDLTFDDELRGIFERSAPDAVRA